MNRREQLGIFPTPESIKENTVEKEREKFFTTIEQDFQGTESLEKLHELKEHSLVHFNHSQEVVLLANRVGVKLGLSDCDLNLVTESALFHDVGKIKIDAVILHNKDDLTDQEFVEMQRHVEYGIEILKEDHLVDIMVVMGMYHEFKKNIKRRNRRCKEDSKIFLKNFNKDQCRRFGGCSAGKAERDEYERLEKIGRILAVVDVVQSIADDNRAYHRTLKKSMAEVIEIAKKELDLEDRYEHLVDGVISAMQESGKYFRNELNRPLRKVILPTQSYKSPISN